MPYMARAARSHDARHIVGKTPPPPAAAPGQRPPAFAPAPIRRARPHEHSARNIFGLDPNERIDPRPSAPPAARRPPPTGG
ncbi:hypothetical protein KGM_209455 [Danaus plexippus plexippus]|uniref:Uncharacterized protein n=1 Tax=Danaus plexippus plexippus TaxID=278856 RepID=A0A212F666_DANPL|nr:hypothetical protein KGM_209455 [Danaus plexippus plexippus]